MDDRRRRLAVGVLVLSLLGLVLLVGPHADPDEADDPRRSSYLSGPQGARALYLTLRELGVPVERRLEPWRADAPEDGLVVLAPSRGPGPNEVESLLAWIREGGILLLATSPGTDTLNRELGLRIVSTAPDTLGPLERVRWEGVEASPEPHRWTDGVDAVPGFRYLFAENTPLPAEKAAEGKAEMRAEGIAEGDDREEPPATEVVLRGPGGQAALLTFPLGNGRVVAWSDAAPLQNSRLRAGPAALLFARMALEATEAGDDPGDPATLRFDEYHHGYRADGGLAVAIRDVALHTGMGRWLLQGAVAILALLLLAGHRLGAPLRRIDTRRRSPLEHVEAVAGAYRKAGARRTARDLLLAGMNRQLGRRSGAGGHSTPPGDPDQSAAARRLHDEWKRGEEADLAALSSAMDDFVREVRGWNPRR